MVMRLTDSLITIDDGQAISLQRRNVTTIRCIERQLWLSQEGLANDIVLSQGESVTLRAHGRIVVQSLQGRALFMVKRPISALASISRAAARLITSIRHVSRPC